MPLIEILQPFCAKGDLHELRRKRGDLTLDAVRYYAARLLVTLQQIHERGVCHRDLKPHNVFLGANLEAYIGDFGLSVVAGETPFGLDEDANKIIGTPEYMAPEMWSGVPYGAPLDVWEYGATLFELCLGRVSNSFHGAERVCAC